MVFENNDFMKRDIRGKSNIINVEKLPIYGIQNYYSDFWCICKKKLPYFRLQKNIKNKGLE